MHGVFDGQLVQSELGRYGSELLLGRTVEADPGQTVAGSERVIHVPRLERFGRAPPISVDRAIDDHRADARSPLVPASDTAARRSPSAGEVVDDLLARREARLSTLRAVTLKATCDGRT